MIWHNKETQWQSFWEKKSKGDQCLLKYSQLFSKVINASSNILIYWFVGGAFREHFTKIFQVKTWTITSSSFIIIVTIKNNRHQPVQHHHEQYHHHHRRHFMMPSKSTHWAKIFPDQNPLLQQYSCTSKVSTLTLKLKQIEAKSKLFFSNRQNTRENLSGNIELSPMNKKETAE